MKNDHLFRYMEDQWARIVRDLPSKTNPLDMRMHMEAMISAVTSKIFGPADPFLTLGQEITARQKLARAARKLTLAYDEKLLSFDSGELRRRDYRHRGIRDRERLLGEVIALAERHEKIAKYLSERKAAGRRGPKGDFSREYMLETLVAFWVHVGGRVASSMKAKRGKEDRPIEDGPLVRFLINASSPALKTPLSPGAARGFIRKMQRGECNHETIKIAVGMAGYHAELF